MRTHQLVVESDNVTVWVNGNGNYFSWLLEFQFGEWELSTMYGRHQGTFPTIGKALRSIDFSLDDRDQLRRWS